MKVKKRRQKSLKAPKIKAKNEKEIPEFQGFPLDYYTYSRFRLFMTDPCMFKIRYINRDKTDSTVSPVMALGNMCHDAVAEYIRLISQGVNEQEAMKKGYDVGIVSMQENFPDGRISYNTTIDTRQKLHEKYSFSYFGYIKEYNYEKRITETLIVEEELKHRVQVGKKILPIPFLGYMDHVYRDEKGRIIIEDHKFVTTYSKEDTVDGAKLIQSAIYYFLVYAELGEAPYSILFREFKTTKNTSGKYKGQAQTKEFEVVFEKTPVIFQLLYRIYEDMTEALLGRAVFVPSLSMMSDDVSLLAYIYQLDKKDIQEQEFDRLDVDSISDFIKKKIEKEGSMKQYLETVERKFISAKTLNYNEMKTEEKIKYKFAEHGYGLNFDSVDIGHSVSLYKFSPSIGIKMSSLEKYAQDIKLVLASKQDIRILAPVPGTDLVGFEVPNEERTFPDITPKRKGFDLALGVDTHGKNIFYDFREAPHTLIGGSTGSGKSVTLNTIIKQLCQITQAELHLFDPKQVELAPFAGEKRVVEFQDEIIEYDTETETFHGGIHGSMKDLVRIMNQRYSTLKENKCRNIQEYNEQGSKMKYKFIIIEEYGDLVASNHTISEMEKVGEYKNGRAKLKTKKRNISKEIEKNLLVLAQKARAAGMHLIIVTQRPSVDVVSGTIKNNFVTKIAFKVGNSHDSKTLIDKQGAETLLGKGDMLLITAEEERRLQGFNL